MNGERFRVKVTVATAIPEEEVRAANLDYLDPADVDIAAWAADPNALVVAQAGEELVLVDLATAFPDRAQDPAGLRP